MLLKSSAKKKMIVLFSIAHTFLAFLAAPPLYERPRLGAFLLLLLLLPLLLLLLLLVIFNFF